MNMNCTSRRVSDDFYRIECTNAGGAPKNEALLMVDETPGNVFAIFLVELEPCNEPSEHLHFSSKDVLCINLFTSMYNFC